nr:hypothetical protein BaRGS_002501 [Batillaria attramentaria]
MNFLLRKMAGFSKPENVLQVDDDGTISIATSSTFMKNEQRFKLNEEFEEINHFTKKKFKVHLSIASKKLKVPHDCRKAHYVWTLRCDVPQNVDCSGRGGYKFVGSNHTQNIQMGIFWGVPLPKPRCQRVFCTIILQKKEAKKDLFSAANLDPRICTDILVANFKLDARSLTSLQISWGKKGSEATPKNTSDWIQNEIKKLVNIKQVYTDVKVLAAIGHWEKDGELAKMMRSSRKRRPFVHQMNVKWTWEKGSLLYRRPIGLWNADKAVRKWAELRLEASKIMLDLELAMNRDMVFGPGYTFAALGDNGQFVDAQENSDSLIQKVSFAISYGMGGIHFVDLNYDDYKVEACAVTQQGNASEFPATSTGLPQAIRRDFTGCRIMYCMYRNRFKKVTPKNTLHPEDIDATYCTHLMFGFFHLRNDTPSSEIGIHPSSEKDFETIEKLVRLKEDYPYLAIMLGLLDIEQANEGPLLIHIETVSNSYTKQERIALEAAVLLRQLNLDGLDLDWLFPTQKVNGSGFPHFLQTIRSVFAEEAERSGRIRLQLATAVYGHAIEYFTGLQQISAAVDIFRLDTTRMNYMTNGWAAYYEICPLKDEPGVTDNIDMEKGGQFLTYEEKGKNIYIRYQDETLIRTKTNMIMDKGFAGCFIPNLAADDYTGEGCNHGAFPLLTAAGSGCAQFERDHQATESPIAILGKELAATPTAGCVYVVCYYNNDARQRPGKGKMLPKDIDPTLCTHLIFSHAVLDGARVTASLPEDVGPEGTYNEFIKLKRRNNAAKMLLSIRGTRSSTYSKLASGPKGFTDFVSNAVKFTKEKGFDGIEIDWEVKRPEEVKKSDRDAFSSLMVMLNTTLKTQGLLLAVKLSGDLGVIERLYDGTVAAFEWCEVKKKGAKVKFIDEQLVPYMVYDNQWIGIENELSIKQKRRDDIKRVCYLSTENLERSRPTQFDATYIPFGICNHYIIDSLTFENDGAMSGLTPTTLNAIRTLKLLLLEDAYIKISFSIKASSETSFREVASSADKRRRLFETLMTIFRSQNLYGVDIQWTDVEASDASTYVDFIRLLHKTLRDNEKTFTYRSGDKFQLSLAVGKKPVKGVNYTLIEPVVDFVNVFSFDYAPGWDNLSHNNLMEDFKASVSDFLKAGVIKKKLIPGLPLYAKVYYLTDPALHNVNNPGVKGPLGVSTKTPGRWTYYELCYQIQADKHKGFKISGYTDDGKPMAGASSVYYNKKLWASYDSRNKIQDKVQWIVKEGLPGYTLYTIDGDVFLQVCSTTT